MSVLCGNCKVHHDSVAEVRACYAPRINIEQVERDMQRMEAAEDLRQTRRDEEAKAAFKATVETAIDVRPSRYEVVPLMCSRHDEPTDSDGSCWECKLPSAPAPQPFRPTKNTKPLGGNIDTVAKQVPEGRYAVETDVVRFYQVDKPAQGKWAGFTFVNQLVGSVGNWQRIPVKKLLLKLELLKTIAENPEESARLFGQKSKHCGYCMSPLSKDRSRASGYGETCASNHGFWYATEAEALEILGEGK